MKLSIFAGLSTNLDFCSLVFFIFIFSILIIIKDFKKNLFLSIAFFTSYLIFYFLYLFSFLNIYIYSNYLWFISLLSGFFVIFFAINNFLFSSLKSNNSTKKNVKIDVPLPLVFGVVFMAFLWSSINFLNFENIITKINYNISYFCFFSIIPVLFAALTPFFAKKITNKNIGNLLILISGIIIAFL